jgi:aminobenzoyl-glutamate utilization protein B
MVKSQHNGILCLIAALVAMVALQTTAVAAERPSTNQLRAEADQEAVSLYKLTQEIVDMLFSFSELGFQEHWTRDYLVRLLVEEGFRVQEGCAGMPTCFIASWGSGRPEIGLMAEIDGLPDTSQRPGVAYRDELIPGGPGHGEGHNAGAAVDVTAAIAVKRIMERYSLPGTITLIPGVAEEQLASRNYMVTAGLVDTMDVVINSHVDSSFYTGYGLRGSGLVSTVFTFAGETAHGVSPWNGRNALRAVELMNAGWNARREQLRLHQRSHYVITDGGILPNVIPGRASVWYYFREMDYDHIRQLHEIGQTIAEAAAMMTDTTVEERVLSTTWPQNFNQPLAVLLYRNIEAVGMPEWSEADIALARAMQELMGKNAIGLETGVGPMVKWEPGIGGSSNDLGDVSWRVPATRLRFPSNIPGMVSHHWSSGVSMATPIAHKGASQAARAIAMTAVEIMAEPQHVETMWRYFREVQTEGVEWKSLTPAGTEPPTFLNADVMERYRPALKELIYDPDRYESYLEQLGVKYPTLGAVP